MFVVVVVVVLEVVVMLLFFPVPLLLAFNPKGDNFRVNLFTRVVSDSDHRRLIPISESL